MQQTLIGVLNASGISFSYAIDLQDCKYARQLWKFFVIRGTIQLHHPTSTQ